jgi:hypothetical protein
MFLSHLIATVRTVYLGVPTLFTTSPSGLSHVKSHLLANGRRDILPLLIVHVMVWTRSNGEYLRQLNRSSQYQ